MNFKKGHIEISMFCKVVLSNELFEISNAFILKCFRSLANRAVACMLRCTSREGQVASPQKENRQNVA